MMENDNELMEKNLKNIKNKIVVLSGKGGVGKSTTSVNIAYSLALNGYKVGILDIDIHGPSIAKMTGIEGKAIYASEDNKIAPIEVITNLYALSIASLTENQDSPIIWRGPMKISVIKQFLQEVTWPELDYLVIDCPPGTGDEPLSIVQFLGKIEGAVIVSTPQDVAFLDARKTINFCRQLKVPVLGIVENMVGFVCPHCNEITEIFKSGGAEKAAKDFSVEILGRIPIDGNIVNSGDDGKAYVYHYGKTPGAVEYLKVTEKIAEKIDLNRQNETEKYEIFAFPVEKSRISQHFGHSKEFIVVSVKDGKVNDKKSYEAPGEGHNILPGWLAGFGVTKLFTSGIGEQAEKFLKQHGIEVFKGINDYSEDELVESYLNNTLIFDNTAGCSGHEGCGSGAGCGCSH